MQGDDAAAEQMPWGSGGLVRTAGSSDADVTAAAFDPEMHLARVRNPDKRVIHSFSQLDLHEVLTRTVMSRLHPSRGFDQGHPPFVPPQQIEFNFLLHLRDAYFGDNVVFDRDRYFSFDRYWAGRDPGLYKDTETIRHIDAGVLISAWGGDAFQHFILDAIPQLAAVINLLESPGFEHVKIVSHWDDAKFAQWFWNRLDLQDRVVCKPVNAAQRHVLHADHVLFPHFSPEVKVRSIYPRHSLEPIQQRLGLFNGSKADLLIYTSRKGLIRSVEDEDVLLERLGKLAGDHGLTLHEFSSTGDWGSDFALFSRARLIIGPHGAGLANIVFAPPGTHVVEFVPPSQAEFTVEQQRHLSYYGLAQAAGHHHWVIEPDIFDFNSPDMRVDAGQVVALVRRILAESDTRSGTPA